MKHYYPLDETNATVRSAIPMEPRREGGATGGVPSVFRMVLRRAPAIRCTNGGAGSR